MVVFALFGEAGVDYAVVFFGQVDEGFCGGAEFLGFGLGWFGKGFEFLVAGEEVTCGEKFGEDEELGFWGWVALVFEVGVFQFLFEEVAGAGDVAFFVAKEGACL